MTRAELLEVLEAEMHAAQDRVREAERLVEIAESVDRRARSGAHAVLPAAYYGEDVDAANLHGYLRGLGTARLMLLYGARWHEHAQKNEGPTPSGARYRSGNEQGDC